MKVTNRSLMARRVMLRALAIMFLAGVSTVANAQIVFDDADGTNASNSGLAPTQLDFSPGSNIVNGTVTNSGDPPNPQNFYTFTIGEGEELTAINLDSLVVTTAEGAPSNNQGFYALVEGSTSASPATGFANLGGRLHDPSLVGNDLLAIIADGGISDGTGFESIEDGDYTFVFQQGGTEISTFSLDFQVSTTAVPEPTSGLVLVGLGVAGLARRRRR